MNGKYVGNRPIRLKKSAWKDRNIDSEKNAKIPDLKSAGLVGVMTAACLAQRTAVAESPEHGQEVILW